VPKNVRTDLHEIFREGWQWASEQTITFWLRFVSWIQVSRAVAEVCTAPVLLVCHSNESASSKRTLQSTTVDLNNSETTNKYATQSYSETCTGWCKR